MKTNASHADPQRARRILSDLVYRIASETGSDPAESLDLTHHKREVYCRDENGLGDEIKSVFTSAEYRAAVRLLANNPNGQA